MFCQKCGNRIGEDVSFCSKCGAPVHGNISQSINEEKLYPNLSNRWVWLIAIIPTFILLIVPLLGLYPDQYNSEHQFTPIIFATIAFVLTCLFLFMDYKELIRNGINNVKPWVGILLIPVYLFIRAARSTKKFNYAIVWSVFYGFYLIMYFYFVVLQN